MLRKIFIFVITLIIPIKKTTEASIIKQAADDIFSWTNKRLPSKKIHTIKAMARTG